MAAADPPGPAPMMAMAVVDGNDTDTDGTAGPSPVVKGPSSRLLHLNQGRQSVEGMFVVSPQRRNAFARPRPERPTAAYVSDRLRLAEDELVPHSLPRLTLVVPMFDEASRIEGSLRALYDAGLDGIRLVLVDDGSSDDTVAVAQSCITQFGLTDSSVLALSTNAGKGAAVRAGVLSATTPYVGFVDADLSLDPLEIRRALNRLHLTKGDLVVGERLVDPSVQPRVRRVASVIFRRVTDMIAPTGVRDPQCALKLFRADVATSLFGALVTNGFAFDVEILMRARRAGYNIDEMAIRWTHQPGSKVDPVRESLRMLRQVRRIGRQVKS